ncbi:MAG: restriction endonuclease subunit S [Pseudomonas sp.]|uniref:restriction endonuclease subunit S n=1 Tax=Pseudomonas sp. TaxID=306 RepID=UPI001A21E2D3|nr:restriction endonuclease subunit S [Pseudomonas sp.]MBJ7374400.1 restriction endonuclease subunit S [Pseudomonas sp.]
MTNLSEANLYNGVAVDPRDEGRESPSVVLKYPAYKDSGVEWLGEVPEHWMLMPIKHLALLNPRKSGFAGDTNQLCSFVPMEKLKTGVVQLDEERPIEEVIGGYTYFEDGDVLQAKVTPCFENMNVAIAKGLTNGIGFGSSEINVLRPCKGVNTEYLFYRVQEGSYMSFCTSSMIGAGGLKRVPTDVINNFKIAAPELFEQIQIARFLDHETARIDALIEEQQRLIQLLKEKRQAVISHAVTKGLDPTVPMKDSGVEWLGKVPAHWNVTRSKFVFRLVSGYAFKSEFFQKNGDGEKVLITPGSFDELGKLYFSEKSTVQYEGEWQSQFELKVGDLVMVLTDLSYKKLILGRAAFVERDDALLNQRIAKVIITPKVKDNYLWFVINSDVMREQLKLTASGATVFHTSPEKVGDCWMALPPEKEQLEITAFIEKFHFKLDKLIQQVIDTINLLSERRTALISAAVTGKIDVRGWQPPASAPSHELEQEAM